MYSRLGMLFESSRKVAGGNVGQISNTANIADTSHANSAKFANTLRGIIKETFSQVRIVFITRTIVSNPPLKNIIRLVKIIRCILPNLIKTQDT